MTSSNDASKKPKRVRAFQPKRAAVTIRLPRELEALCARDAVEPGELIRQFIADLCDIRAWTKRSAFDGNGQDAHRAALAYHQVAQQVRWAKAQQPQTHALHAPQGARAIRGDQA